MEEEKILSLLMQGKTCKEASKILNINPSKISGLMTNKFKRLKDNEQKKITGYVVLNVNSEMVYQGECFPVILSMSEVKLWHTRQKLSYHYSKAYHQQCIIKFHYID